MSDSTLTPAERERLFKLNEELGETQECLGALTQALGKTAQTISKTLLHGYSASFEGVEYNNRADLEREVGDVLGTVDYLIEKGDLNSEVINQHRVTKRNRMLKYMNHQTA